MTGIRRYSTPARILHWGMALCFLFMWGCGYAMTTLVEEDGALEELLFGLHISMGVTLAFLLVLRIAVRLLSAPPPLPADFPKLDWIASHLGHFGLYALPALIVLIGWAEVDLGGHTVQWFGLEIPKLFPTKETWQGIDLIELTEMLHKWLAYAMLALAVVHAAAVFKHRWFDGHDILYRMTFRKLGK